MQNVSLQCRLLWILLSVLWAWPSYAGSITLSWTAPTQNDDGTALTDLDGYKLYESRNNGGPYSLAADVDNPATATYVLDDRPPGDHFLVATAYNTVGIESVFSGEVKKTVAASGFVVIATTAFTTSITRDIFRTVQVGTVALGTPCDRSMSANGFYLVLVEDTVIPGNAGATVVFAACGER